MSWKVFEEFPQLHNNLRVGSLTSNTFEEVETFVCHLYSPSTSEASINAVRAKLFSKGTKDLENLPPTADALKQHISHAHYQSLIWRASLIPQPNFPPPAQLGWTMQNVEVCPLQTLLC